MPRRDLAPLALALALAACAGDDAASATDTTTASTGGTTTASTGTTTASTTAVDTETSGMSGTSASTDPTATTDATTGTTGPGTTDPSTTDPSTTDPGTTDATDSTTDATTDATTGTTMPICPMGKIVCDGDTAQTCDGMGGYVDVTPCADACADDLGCVLCVPGSGACDGDVAKLCNDQGDGWIDSTCDPVQGVVCDPNAGKCFGACSAESLGTSYIGCDYYPTVTANVVGNNFNFAVVVSNTSNSEAKITVTRGANTVTTTTVAKDSVKVINLPWVDALKAGAPSKVVVDGAYRLRSDQPITLYQYNPLEYQLGGAFSYTNDASVLMPVNAWTGDYWVVTRNTLNGLPGIYAVVASQDGTTVTLAPSKTGGIVAAGGGVAANGTGVIKLDQGDVLAVMSASGGGGPDISDLTGTHVTADRPIQVIGAHQCTYIPYNITACDHLEESNLPFEALAKEYLVTTPLVKPQGQNPFPKARMVRVIATADNTAVTYDPPQAGAPTALAKAGDYFEIAATAADFKVSADQKIAVAEYMQGQQAGGNTGDPAMTIAVPTEQYRTSYLFHAPTNYESSFVNITAPMAAKITLDGAPIPALSAIGGTGYGVARVQLSNAGDGTHAIAGDLAFGVQVYGYGQYTSYWYPGGLDLKYIPQ